MLLEQQKWSHGHRCRRCAHVMRGDQLLDGMCINVARCNRWIREAREARAAYPVSSPKHPDYHDTMSDLWDMREGK